MIDKQLINNVENLLKSLCELHTELKQRESFSHTEDSNVCYDEMIDSLHSKISLLEHEIAERDFAIATLKDQLAGKDIDTQTVVNKEEDNQEEDSFLSWSIERKRNTLVTDKRVISELESEGYSLTNKLNNLNARAQEQDARRQENDQKQRIMSLPVTRRYTEVMISKGNLTDYGFRPCALEHSSSGFKISFDVSNHPMLYAVDEGNTLSIVPSEGILRDTLRSFFEPFFNVNNVYVGSTLYLGSPAKLVATGIANVYEVRERGNVTI